MVSLTPYNLPVLPAPPVLPDGVQESGGRLEFAVYKVRNHGILSLQKAEVTRQRDSSGITQWAPTTASMPQGKCPHTLRSLLLLAPFTFPTSRPLSHLGQLESSEKAEFC